MNKLRIKKFDVLSVGKIYAVMMLIMMLLICIPYGLFIIALSLSGASSIGGEGGLALGGGGVVAGLLVMIGLPIVYGIIGFIAGIIGALIYNILSGMVGGVEIEVETIY